jgi:hypothetical protein
MKNLVAALTIILTLSACLGTSELTKRYKDARFEDLKEADAKGYVTVDVQSYPMTSKPPQRKRVFDLSDHGQQAYVTALSEKEKDADKFLSKISLPLERAQPKTGDDRTNFMRKLVFSINNETKKPANRIDRIKLALTLKAPDAIRFSTWDRIVTNYQTVDLGKLTLGATTSFALSPEITTEAGASGTLGSVSYEKSRQEEITVKDRLVISGTLTDAKAILFEKGVSGMDLSENLVAEIEFEAIDIAGTALIKFDNLFKEDDKPETDQKKIKIIETSAYYPNLQADIKGDLEYDFVFREVMTGEKTIPEGDDEVVFQRGHGKVSDITLIKKSDYANKTWRISDGKNFVHILFKGRKDPVVIDFSAPEDAKAFLRWVKALKSTTIQDNEIRIGPERSIADFDKLDVVILQTPQKT